MAKFAQYYLKYTLEHMFSAEYKDRRQQIFGAFFAQNDSIEFAMGEGEERKVYKHQVYHLAQNKDIIVIVSTMNMTGAEVSALSAGVAVKIGFAGNVCHVFNKETGINLEA